MEESGDTKIVASFPKNSQQAVCVGESEYKGRKLLFIRVFVPSLVEGEFVATKSGVNFPAALFPDILKGIRDVGDVMSTDKVVAKIQKTSSQQIWVGLNTYKNIPLLYVRVYSQYGDEEEYKPTKQGVSMRVDLYPQLLEAVEKLADLV